MREIPKNIGFHSFNIFSYDKHGGIETAALIFPYLAYWWKLIDHIETCNLTYFLQKQTNTKNQYDVNPQAHEI